MKIRGSRAQWICLIEIKTSLETTSDLTIPIVHVRPHGQISAIIPSGQPADLFEIRHLNRSEFSQSPIYHVCISISNKYPSTYSFDPTQPYRHLQGFSSTIKSISRVFLHASRLTAAFRKYPYISQSSRLFPRFKADTCRYLPKLVPRRSLQFGFMCRA